MNVLPYTQPGQTGVIQGEPNDVYHDCEAISNSQLSMFLTDPKRFEGLRNGSLEREEKPCWDLGSLFHVLSLEGIDEYQAQYVHESLVPQKPTSAQVKAYEKYQYIDKPTKAQVEAHAKQSALIETHAQFWRHHAGKTVAKADDDAKARAMRNALFADTDAADLLYGWETSRRELTMRTGTTKFGFAVQVKFDYFEDTGFAVDLKSVRNLDAFKRDFFKFGYYRQAAFYSLVCELVTGVMPQFYFIAVESEAPYEVAVFWPEPAAIEAGIDEIEVGLAALGKCLASGEFPKRFPGVKTLGLSPFEAERSGQRVNRLRELIQD